MEEDACMRNARGVVPEVVCVACIHHAPMLQRNGENHFIGSRAKPNLLNGHGVDAP